MDAEVRCARCGRELDSDVEEDTDDPTVDAGEPICDECKRDEEREDDFVLLDLFDGQLDGHLDEG
jgi:hypothetical protein